MQVAFVVYLVNCASLLTILCLIAALNGGVAARYHIQSQSQVRSWLNCLASNISHLFILGTIRHWKP